jgi:hypothetical protein
VASEKRTSSTPVFCSNSADPQIVKTRILRESSRECCGKVQAKPASQIAWQAIKAMDSSFVDMEFDREGATVPSFI